MKDLFEIISKRKVLFISILSIVLILGIVMGYSFSYFISTESTNNNVVKSDCFKISFEDSNDINIDKAYPISESEASSLTPYTFTIKNICANQMNYVVNMEVLTGTSLSTDYIRYKLNSDNSVILGQRSDVTDYFNTSVIESRTLENGILVSNQEKTFNLRMWIDENAQAEQTENKIFKGKVVVITSSR